MGEQAALSFTDSDKRAVLEFKSKTQEWIKTPTVAEALQFYFDHHAARERGGTVNEAVSRHIEGISKRGASLRHQSTVKYRLAKFLKHFGEHALSIVSSDQIERWIIEVGGSPVSQKNLRATVHALFAEAARDRRILYNPVEQVRITKAASGEPGTITPQELYKFLFAMTDRSRAAFAIQALAGLRAAEAGRLEWQDVKLAESTITVSAGAAKTASRRIVPICPALKSWLTPLQKDSGKIAPTAQQMRLDALKARTAAGIADWPPNCLRHGCASAWAATEPDVSRVASWLGNSPVVVHRHYRALWTAEQGKAWLAVAPGLAEVPQS